MKLINSNRKSADNSRRNYGKTIYRYLGATALLALSSVVFLTSCADSASEQAENVGGITARQVIENPSAYVGKTVTVSGDVEEIWNPRAFNMDSGLSAGELLVIGREPFPQVGDAGNRGYVVNDTATVTGVVRMLVTADIEREIGWDLEPQIEANFNGKPVLIAQSVSFRGATGSAAATTANANNNQPALNNNADQTTANNPNQAAGDKLTDAGVYGATTDKLSLVGKEAQFSDLRVARVVGPRTFTVAAAGGSEIFVMLDEESARGVGSQGNIGVGKTMNLTGKFERLQAAEIDDISNNRFRPLTAQERDFMKNTQIFLQAEKVSELR